MAAPFAPPLEAESDVLVIGGGAAGCLAAIGARQQGAEVLLVEKGGSILRSGSASGIKIYIALLEQGPWDTPEAYLEELFRRSEALRDRRREEVFAQHSKQVFDLLESFGMPFRDPSTGSYCRISIMEAGTGEHPRAVYFRGAEFKPVLARQAHKMGVQVMEQVAIQGLLTRRGSVVGAVGFHVRSGQLHILRARAVVLTAGGAVRLFGPPTSPPYVTQGYPYNTGDGHAMAFRAGAAVTNMEFTWVSLAFHGFASPGLAGFVGHGSRLMNAQGEYYMDRYHPLGMKAPRNFLVNATLQEVAAGRGPCFMDTRHLSQEAVEAIKQGILNEKPALLEFFRSRGLELGRDLIPVELTEIGCRGQGGILTDERCASTLEGLFAAGEGAILGSGVAGACTMGYVAGGAAAAHAKEAGRLQELDRGQVEELREMAFAPLMSQDGSLPQELEEEIRKVMRTHVGLERNEAGLDEGIGKLKALRQEGRHLKAGNLHELLRANEARNLADTGLLVATAARARQESRMKPFHNRTDYPERDDELWRQFVVLERAGEDDIRVSLRPLPV